MGYRGKVEEQGRARELRAEGLKLAEIVRLHAEAAARIGTLSEREFLVAGAALYAGEGAKTDGSVRFANTNPRLVVFFCAWLRHFFDIDEPRLRVALYLHDGLHLVTAVDFWSQTHPYSTGAIF